MKNIMLRILIVTLLATSVQYVSATDYYADAGAQPGGNGTEAKPFDSLQAAVDAAQPGDAVLAKGVFRETVTFPRSGIEGKPITVRNWPEHKATISGCDLVKGWTVHTGSIYKAAMDWDVYDGDGNLVFVNGNPMPEATWPNIADLLNRGQYASVDGAGNDPFWLTDKRLKGLTGDWVGAMLWVSAGDGFVSYVGKVTGLDANAGRLEFDYPITSPWYYPKRGNFYFLSRNLATLDAPGEWYKDVAGKTLYLMPPGKADPNTTDVEAKRRLLVLDLMGRSSIHIEGLELRGGNLNLKDASNCLFRRMRIHGIDKNYRAPSGGGCAEGLTLDGSHNTLRDSEVFNMFGPGVTVKGQHNNVINNYIHDINFQHTYADGVKVEGAYHLISHNTICRLGRAGLGGRFRTSIIQYNRVYDALRLSNDGGIIYLFNNDYGGSEVHHNWFYDCRSGTKGEGIYYDSRTAGVITYRNVTWNVPSTLMRLNTSCNFCLFINNTIGGSGSVDSWGNCFSDDMWGTVFVNNIWGSKVQLRGKPVVAHNLVSQDAKWIDAAKGDYRLQEGSPAIGAGIPFPGIALDAKPDCGAFAYGKDTWVPGHDFENPPNPVFKLNDAIPHRNLVVNSGFEYDALADWKVVSGKSGICTQSGWEFVGGSKPTTGYAMVRSHEHAALLTAGDRLEQTIDGLKPNTRYILTGWARIHGPLFAARSYVLEHGGVKKSGFRGATIGPLRDGQWVKYEKIDFGKGLYDRFAAGLIGEKPCKLTVRIDGPEGETIGVLEVKDDKDGSTSWQETKINVVTGVHDVCLVFQGEGDLMHLNCFKFHHSDMKDKVSLGVSTSAGVKGSTSIGGAGWGTREHRVVFTTGPADRSATISIEKDNGPYLAYVDDIGLIEAYSDELTQSTGAIKGVVFRFDKTIPTWMTIPSVALPH